MGIKINKIILKIRLRNLTLDKLKLNINFRVKTNFIYLELEVK